MRRGHAPLRFRDTGDALAAARRSGERRPFPGRAPAADGWAVKFVELRV